MKTEKHLRLGMGLFSPSLVAFALGIFVLMWGTSSLDFIGVSDGLFPSLNDLAAIVFNLLSAPLSLILSFVFLILNGSFYKKYRHEKFSVIFALSMILCAFGLVLTFIGVISMFNQ